MKLRRRRLSVKDSLNLILRGRIEVKEGGFPRIYIYRDYVESESDSGSKFISGFLVKSPVNVALQFNRELDDSFLVKGFENLLHSLQRGRIPISYVYSSSFSGDDENAESAVYILTHARDEDRLSRNMEVIETSFKSVFPIYELEKLSGRDIFRIVESFLSDVVDGVGGGAILPLRPPPPTKSVSEPVPEYYVPSLREASAGNILLGTCLSRIGEGPQIKVSQKDLSTHLVVLGVTGSGKTTTTASLLNRLSRDGLKYLVFDWSNEYSRLLKETVEVVYAPGLTDEYSINPLLPMDFEDTAEHLAMVTDIFADTYNFTHPQSFMFKEALNVALEHFKVFGDEVPNLRTLISVLEKLPLRSYFDAETKLALIRRIKPLVEGQAGRALCGRKNVKISELIDRNVVIELGHFRETRTRQIFTQLLLKQVYDYRVRAGIGELTHVTVIEEGRYIVPSRRFFDQPSTAERMIAELRKFGESIFVVAQFPTQISIETIKNAGCLIIHRLNGPEDLDIVRNVVSLNDRQVDYIKRMNVGEAVVKMNRFHESVLVKVIPEVST